MRNLIFLLVWVFLASCTSQKQYTLSDSEKEKIVHIVENSLKQEIYLDTERVAHEVKILESFLKKIDDKAYLVSLHGEYITHSLLKENSQTKEYVYAGISCTSKQCASSSGCVPKNETECTPCGYGAGDCTKIVSSVSTVQ